MESNDLFVRASRAAWRYFSPRGELTTEQLWTLPLLSVRQDAAGNSLDLNTVAKVLNSELKALGEESFVEKENPNRAIVAAKLDLVKFVISTKQAEAKANQDRLAKAQEREEILAALRNRKSAALASADEDELQHRLAALDAA